MEITEKKTLPVLIDHFDVSDAETATSETSAGFREVGKRSTILAMLFGTVILTACVVLGRSYFYFVPFLGFSLLMTLVWRQAPRPLIYLASISAATPLAISRYQINGNLVFALWFALTNPRWLFRLPLWVYLSGFLALLGMLTSSINWLSGDLLRSFMRQGTLAFNFYLAPFFLLPLFYVRMKESRNHAANLQGLLFCLIVPSTVLLISTKLFGTIINSWQASLHSYGEMGGFFQYKLGRVMVNFLRTEVGFILAALSCAAAAVAISPVRGWYRWLAGACLAANVFLLLTTGSFGSILACLCGLAAIFYGQLRTASPVRLVASALVVCCLALMAYGMAPQSTKEYLGKRYEHRVTNANDDRLWLWGRAVEHLLMHPEGVGLTLSVNVNKITSFIHNDYLVYAVSYGVIGGLAYAFLLGGLLFTFLMVRRSADNDLSALAVHLAGLGVTVALTVNSMTDHMNSNRWYFNVIWSLIWYCYFCSRPAERSSSFGDGLPETDRWPA